MLRTRPDEIGINICMNRTLNIGFLNHFSDLGGAEMCSLTLMKQLDRELFRVYLAAPAGGALVTRAKDAHIPVETFPLPGLSGSPLRTVKTLFRLKKWIKSNNLDLIHANSLRTAAYAALIARTTPYIFHDHELIPLRWGHHFVGRSAARIITVSQEGKKRYRSTSYPVECIHNGIDVPDIKDMRNPGDVRDEFHIPPDAPLLIIAGRMIADKGHMDLIHAMQSVLKEIPETHLIIVGGAKLSETDEYENTLKRSVISMGLDKNINFTGFRDDLMSLFNAADIVVHPAIKDNLATVVIEAMALEKPVISTRTGGIMEIISSDEDGILIDPGDSESLTRAIISLLSDSDKRKVLGQKAGKTVSERFSVSRYADQISQIYQQVIEGRIVSGSN